MIGIEAGNIGTWEYDIIERGLLVNKLDYLGLSYFDSFN